MGFDLSMKVTRKAWLKEGLKGRTAKGLKLAGQAYQSEMRTYPAAPPNEGLRGTGTRMNDMAKAVNYRVLEGGTVCELLGPPQASYALFGTGIYGKRGAPITPVSGKFLSWVVTDMTHPLAGQRVVARSVSGFIWEGKLDKVIAACKEAFILGLQQDGEE